MNVPPVASAPSVSSGVPSATASAGRWGWGAFAPTVTNRFSPPSCSARRGCYKRLTSPRPSVLFAIRPLHYSRSPTAAAAGALVWAGSAPLCARPLAVWGDLGAADGRAAAGLAGAPRALAALAAAGPGAGGGRPVYVGGEHRPAVAE